jgi:hypothetical protein
MVYRAVYVVEVDNRIDSMESVKVSFMDRSVIKCEATLPMGPRLLELIHHWLTYSDDLFTDVFSKLGK